MVNTMVKDPQNRKINRKLDRQKKARMKQNRKALLDPLDSTAGPLAEVHTLKITELKKDRDILKNTEPGISNSRGREAVGEE